MRSKLGVSALVLFLFAPALRAEEPPPPRVVEITAKRFEFVPNEVHLKKGEAVTIRLTSEDVTHGFFSRKLGIDAEVSPGKPSEVKLTPQAEGRYTVICDHFCGAGHGGMKMTVIVE